ncbi:MAG: hypothetical protein IJX27_05965 [Clostridia bacterium]|nr:hypothetical protein [Clostridia bacterium]
MKTITVFAFIFLGFYLFGCIRPHVIISIQKYMEIYVKIFFLKIHVASSNKPPPPDEELDLPTKKGKEKKEKKEKPKKEKKEKKQKDGKALEEKKPKKEKKVKTKVKKEKNKPVKKKKKKRRLREIFRRGFFKGFNLKKFAKSVIKAILKFLLQVVRHIGFLFAYIGKFIWNFIYGRFNFLREKLGMFHFKVRKKVKEPKKSKIASIHIDIPKMFAMLRDVLGSIFLKLWRYFRVRVKNFHITVATDDAATTAMMYGAVCGYGDAILTILEKALDFKIEKDAKVGASCDYLSEEMKMDIEIDISISIGNLFRYIFGIVGAAIAGVLRGIQIRINKEYFAHSRKYKTDMAKYEAYKAELEKLEAHKAAKKAEREKKLEEKNAKKAEKAALKAELKAKKEAEKESSEKADEAEEEKTAEANETEDLKTEASERDNLNE